MIKKVLAGAIMGILSLAAQVPEKPLLKIFDKAHKLSAQENVLLSPYSIQQCFGMVACGAGERSGMELRRILGLDELAAKELQLAGKSLKKCQNAQFNSCNTVLFNNKLALQRDFVNQAVNLFDGKIYQVDFQRKTECVNFLNKLIAEQSRNMFDKVFQERDLAGDPDVILMNVLYFKSRWENEFETYMTRKRFFTLPDGNKYKVKMMEDERWVPYYNDGNIHGVIIDYAEKRFGMMFLMTVDPQKPVSVVTGYLADNGLKQIIANASDAYKSRIRLPKLKLESDCNLKLLFQNAGMKDLFDPVSGDLTYMAENITAPLYIDQARQLVKLDLNESGTEMAAVTYAMVAKGAAPMKEEKKNIFYADRPFAMILFDRETGAILLAGVINKPEKI